MSTVSIQTRPLTASATPLSRWLRDGWLLIAAVGLVYAPTLWHLAKTWWTSEDYSFGLFIPFIILFFLWRTCDDLRRLPVSPTRFGLLVILTSQMIYLVGYLGAEFFLQGFSFVLLLAGLILAIRGWPTFQKTSFLLLLLFLSIPLPTLILSAAAFPLQLVASSWAEFILRLLGVPVLRDGNVLQLDTMTLNVTEACSGIRSLASLVTAGVVVAYFLPSRWWLRTIFVLSTIPVAMAANAFRVAGTGLLGEFVGERWATGFYHLFTGWIVFVVAFCLLCGEWAIFQRLSRRYPSIAGIEAHDHRRPPDAFGLDVSSVSPYRGGTLSRRIVIPSAILLLSFGLRIWLGATPVTPARQSLADFPTKLGDWTMLRSDVIDPGTLGILKPDDYLQRLYGNSHGKYASIFIAYYRSQQAGETMHSPKHCLPGSGWQPVENDQVLVGTDPGGRPIRVNRYVVEKGEERDVVLYWYQEHGRIIASEYWGKLYMIWDTIRSGRRDGAIVRVIVPMYGKEETSALNAALDMVRTSTPYLPRFLPN